MNLKNARKPARQITKEFFSENMKEIVGTINELQKLLLTKVTKEKLDFYVLSSLDVGVFLPVIVIYKDGLFLHIINPTYTDKVKIKDTELMIESSFMVPEVQCLVPRPKTVSIEGVHISHDKKFKIRTITYTGKKAAKLSQALELLEGKFYMDFAEPITDKVIKSRQLVIPPTMGKVMRITVGDKFDYFIEGENKLFFGKLEINPEEYSKEAVYIGCSVNSKKDKDALQGSDRAGEREGPKRVIS